MRFLSTFERVPRAYVNIRLRIRSVGRVAGWPIWKVIDIHFLTHDRSFVTYYNLKKIVFVVRNKNYNNCKTPDHPYGIKYNHCARGQPLCRGLARDSYDNGVVIKRSTNKFRLSITVMGGRDLAPPPSLPISWRSSARVQYTPTCSNLSYGRSRSIAYFLLLPNCAVTS